MTVVESDYLKIKELLNKCLTQPDKINSLEVDYEPNVNNYWLNYCQESAWWGKAISSTRELTSDEKYKQLKTRLSTLLFPKEKFIGKHILNFNGKEDQELFDKVITEFEAVPSDNVNNKYDFIFAYDVFDHVVDPVNQIKTLYGALNASGTAFIRFHPWSSRHGGHCLKTLNKAFIHWFLDEEYLPAKKPLLQKVMNPFSAYDEWLTRAGVGKLVNKNFITHPVEKEFLKVPEVRDVLLAKSKMNLKQLDSLLSIQFVDYIIGKEN